MPGKKFHIILNKWYQGFAPTYWKNSNSEFGNPGHANAMVHCNVLDPTYLNQGFALADLTNGNQTGVVDELIRFILDEGMNGGVLGFGLGSTKLFELSASTVTDDGDFPHTVTSMNEGQSIVTIGDTIYYFFNVSGAGNIGKHVRNTSTFDDDWGSTVPTGAAALLNAKHPSAGKENIILFGNGRYAGIYTGDDDTLDPTKLDFGVEKNVQDIIFHNGQWLIAVNSDNVGNVASAQVYLYDASGVSNLLTDEMLFTIESIGWIKAVNGVVFITYVDTNGAWLGYINGRSITPLKRLPSLPEFFQKTIFDGALLFIANSLVHSGGSLHKDLPFQLSQIAEQGHPTVGAIANSFGTPLIGSTQSTSYRLAKFSGFSIGSIWDSLIFTLLSGDELGVIDKIVVLTPILGSGARCDLTIKSNQGASTSPVMQITTSGKTRHVFKKVINNIEDFRVALNWANGSASNACPIREIHIMGHMKNK